MVGDIVGCWFPTTGDTVLRLHPVVPLLFTVARLKPPMKPPHEMFFAFSKSPMFLPDINT